MSCKATDLADGVDPSWRVTKVLVCGL